MPAGSVLGLLGPNGSGKTTAVSILSTSLRPDAGRATVGGLDVVTRAAAVRRVIGFAGQFAAVDPNLTGRENLTLIGRLSRVGRRQARIRADELLASFGLNAAAGRLVRGYSGGIGAGSTWPRRCCTSRRCCSSMSPPPAWTRRAASCCGTRCGTSPGPAPPCC